MRLRVACLFAATAMVLASSAHAVTNIQFERWSGSSNAIPVDMVPPVDSVLTLSVNFDAVTTGLDVASGFRFALAERDADGNDVLLRIGVPPCGSYPSPGSPIMVFANIKLYCDVQGQLRARNDVGSIVVWCETPPAGACHPPNNFFGPTPGSSESEKFELVVLDENDQEGSFPTPEDTFHSLAAGPGQSFDLIGGDFADNGDIGIFADPGGNLCSDTIQPLVPFRWYLVARLAGFTRCGGMGFFGRVGGVPPNLFLNITGHPNSFLIGSIIGPGGAVGFSQCEPGADDVIVLATIDGISNGPMNDVVLELLEAPPPLSSNPWLEPFVLTCPDYISGFERHLRGTRFIVNPTTGNECDPTVHVEETSWERFKALYR